MTQVWQIAAGDRCRNYQDLFLKHDIMFMGPGRYGDYEGTDAYVKNKLYQVCRFARDVKSGDMVLLRFGYSVETIGLVDESGYRWTRVFDDVFGWDLQHTRRVIWQHHLAKELKQIQKDKELFADRKQIPTFTAVKDRAVLDPIEHLFDKCQSRPLKPLPEQVPEPLLLDELGEELYSKGLPNESVDKVISTVQRQRRLAKWYDIYGTQSGRPTEHEVVTHMILPLLLALGWSEQLLAIEWHKIDLAAFWGTPTTKETCCLVCEAKGLGHGLQNIFAQATSYVGKSKLNNCRRILLTDGTRLYLYQRKENGDWDDMPVGYLNIRLIRTNHIAPANTNAVDTIMALTPAGIGREVGK